MGIFYNVIHYSLKLKPKERVFIFADDESRDYTLKLCGELLQEDVVPVVLWNDIAINRLLIKKNNKDIDSLLYDLIKGTISKCDAAIMIDNNIESYSGFNPDDVMIFKNNYYLKIFQQIMSFKRWVYFRYPNRKLASLFGLTYSQHKRLLINVNNFDYSSLKQQAIKLKNILDSTSKIRIIGYQTDIEFMKRGINSVICCGDINLPDGEVYTAPEKYSVNGHILFDVDSYFRGDTYKNIFLNVKDGKIIDCSCNITEQLKRVLNSDDGSCYFGEFAFGLNPFITRNYNDNLFNEKMARTIHMAIGRSHLDSSNGNESIIHWDLIKQMQENCEIFFDDRLVYHNGEFTIDELVGIFARG